MSDGHQELPLNEVSWLSPASPFKCFLNTLLSTSRVTVITPSANRHGAMKPYVAVCLVLLVLGAIYVQADPDAFPEHLVKIAHGAVRTDWQALLAVPCVCA